MKYGFVYLWWDKGRKRFYIGSHWGTENDGYICSSDAMRDARKRRPQDFKRRILKRIYTSIKDLRNEEQRWLDMISYEEFGQKYYNISSKVNRGDWTTNEEAKKRYYEGLKHRKRNWSPEAIASHRQKMKEFWAKNKESQKEKMKIAAQKPEEKKRKSEATKKTWQDPNYQQFQRDFQTARPRNNKGQFINN